MVALAQVQFDHVSGLPEDRVVNTFHFNPGGTMGTTKADEMANRIAAGYELATAGLRITDILGGQMSGVWRVKVYDLADAEPRVPIVTSTRTPFTPSGTALPQEVAICCSFQAIPQSGANQASRRNRVYIGPLGVSVNAANASDVPARPTTAAKNTIIEGIAKLAVPIGDSAVKWVAYSPKLLAFAEVHDLWVDDAFDTQRRRGERPTARTTKVL